MVNFPSYCIKQSRVNYKKNTPIEKRSILTVVIFLIQIQTLLPQATLKFSWLRGPDTPLKIGGRHLRAVYSLLPVQPGLGISVSVFIYADTLYITSTTDKALGDVGGFLLYHLNAQVGTYNDLLTRIYCSELIVFFLSFCPQILHIVLM